jgi:hypothetical protein
VPSRQARFGPRNRELLAHASCVTAITDTLVGLCQQLGAASHKGGAHASNDLCSSGVRRTVRRVLDLRSLRLRLYLDRHERGGLPTDSTDGVGLNDWGQVVGIYNDSAA